MTRWPIATHTTEDGEELRFPLLLLDVLRVARIAGRAVRPKGRKITAVAVSGVRGGMTPEEIEGE